MIRVMFVNGRESREQGVGNRESSMLRTQNPELNTDKPLPISLTPHLPYLTHSLTPHLPYSSSTLYP